MMQWCKGVCHNHTHTHIYIYTHTCIHVSMYPCHPSIHAGMHTYKHTYIRTYTQVYRTSWVTQLSRRCAAAVRMHLQQIPRIASLVQHHREQEAQEALVQVPEASPGMQGLRARAACDLRHRPLLNCPAQRLQYPLIKEGTSNHISRPYYNLRYIP